MLGEYLLLRRNRVHKLGGISFTEIDQDGCSWLPSMLMPSVSVERDIIINDRTAQQVSENNQSTEFGNRVFHAQHSFVIIGFGLAGLLFMAISSILSGKIFLIFSPIFMM